MVARKPTVCAMDQADLAWSRFSMKSTQTASTRQVHVYFMLSRPPKTSSFMVPMCAMPLPKRCLQNRASTSGTSKHLLNGGRIIEVDPLSLRVMSSQSYLQCMATQNPPASGRSTPMPYYATLASHPQYTSRVCRLVWAKKVSLAAVCLDISSASFGIRIN